MQWGTDNPHADPAEQRERLSAWLDGELEAGERADLEGHLEGCAWCQRELAALREVRDLVRALPSPRLPRSFALPETDPLPDPAAVGYAPPLPLGDGLPSNVVSTAEVAHARARRTSRWAPVARRVGGMVAVLGLALLGGSFLLGLLQSGGHGATASATNAPASDQHNPSAGGPVRAPTAATGQTSAPLPQQTSTQQPTSSYGPTIQLSSGEEVPLVPLVGGGLLGGGLIVLVSAGVADRGARRHMPS